MQSPIVIPVTHSIIPYYAPGRLPSSGLLAKDCPAKDCAVASFRKDSYRAPGLQKARAGMHAMRFQLREKKKVPEM